jgi:cell wall-associated NlpC family hydrolase
LTQNRPERPATIVKPKPTQPRSDARRILRIARSNLGAKFRMGAVGGGNLFDCSGFVYSVYKDAGLLSKIGGSRMVGTAYWRWFQSRGLANRKNPKPGDLIIWGKNGKAEHMGIYIGANRAISALVNPWGVRVHRINGLFDAHANSRMRVLAYLHVSL